MNERESGGYQARRFEAMQGARNAFTGNREGINTRSQQLASEKNNTASAQTFTREQLAAKTNVISTQQATENSRQAQSRAELQSAWDTYGQMEQGLLKSEQAFQLNIQLPLAIEQKLGEVGKEQVLSAIKARKAQAEKAANTEAVAQKQALTQQEIKLEVDKLAALAPENLLIGSLIPLAIWFINRLPNKVYKTTAIIAVLSLVLAACTTINKTPTVEIPTFTGPTSAETGNIDATLDPAAQATATAAKEQLNSASTAIVETKQASRADAFLESYLAGQSVDVSQLTPAEYKDFSVKLAEKKNAERGVNPVLYKNEAYVHPDTYMMMDYDGQADMAETIEMYLAIAGKDAEGNLQIIDEEGKTVTIANSADVDWNMVVTDPNDTRIDLAHTGPVREDNGATAGQNEVSPEVSIIPIVFLAKQPGSIYFERTEGGYTNLSLYQFLKIETDQAGNPIMARKFLVFPAGGAFGLVEEGLSDMIAFNEMNEELGSSELNNSMTTNSVYYMKIRADQEDIYKTWIYASPNNYTGVVDGNEAALSLTGQAENQKDIILLGGNTFIKKAN